MPFILVFDPSYGIGCCFQRITGVCVQPAERSGPVDRSLATSLAWYCAFTDARAEFALASALNDVRLDCYVPKLTRWERHHTNKRSRKAARVTRPLFERYVFVRADDIDRPQFVSEVNNTRGVVELLSNNHVPLRVPDVAIAKLIKAESDGRFDQTKEPFNPGERVRVMQGPLAITEPRIGEFLRRRNADRVVVLLSMLGGETEVDVNLDWIEKA